MSKYVIKKIGRIGSLVAAVCLLAFLLLRSSPIDPVQAYVGADMMNVGPEQRQMIAERWGLNKSVPEQFVCWGTAVVQGDFGTSMIFRRPVLEVIGERFVASLALMGTAWVLSGVFGFGLGVVAGMKPGSWQDRLICWYSYTLASMPAFWLGLLMLLLFGVWLEWFPVGMGVPAGVLAEQVTWGDRIRHLVLPALTLSVIGVANIALHTREKLIDILSSDYVLFARAQGATTREIFWRHGLRNSILPAMTLQMASLSELFGGAVLAEQVFSYPGLGQTIVEAGLRGDVPLLLGIVIFSSLFVCAGNLTADLLYHWIDPRIREEAAV